MFIKISGSPAAKKATAISIFLYALNQCCGAFSMMNYTNKIFEDAGSTLPPNTASTIVASVQLFANCVTLVLVDCAGRKILITISSMLTAIGLISMGLFDLYKEQLEAYKWISVVAFSMIILAASIGMLPLTFVVPNEILPKKVYHPIFYSINFHHCTKLKNKNVSIPFLDQKHSESIVSGGVVHISIHPSLVLSNVGCRIWNVQLHVLFCNLLYHWYCLLHHSFT